MMHFFSWVEWQTWVVALLIVLVLFALKVLTSILFTAYTLARFPGLALPEWSYGRAPISREDQGTLPL